MFMRLPSFLFLALVGCGGMKNSLAKIESVDGVVVRVSVPEPVRGDVRVASFGCEMKDGTYAALVIEPEEFKLGVFEKTLNVDRAAVAHCGSSLVIDAHPEKISENDLPLWAPYYFNSIDKDYDTLPENVVLDLDSWNVSSFSISVDKSAFEKRDAEDLFLDVQAADYMGHWMVDDVKRVTKDKAPVSVKGYILYQKRPVFRINSYWFDASGYKTESNTTSGFEIRIN
jgi:hypothetical protein